MIKLSNVEISQLLDQLVFYRQLSGANPFSIKAFSHGARFIENYFGDPLNDDLTKQTGIGKRISDVIREAAISGSISELEKLKSIHPNVHDLTKVAGIGAKRALKFHDTYNISTRPELLTLLEAGTIKDDKLLEAVKFSLTANERMPRYMVEQRIGGLLYALFAQVEKISVVGSMRRKRETIKDVDILVVAKDRDKLMDIFVTFGNVLSRGPDKCSIQVDGGAIKFQTDLLCTTNESWGAALNYFTGSKEHNVMLRTMAKSKGLTLNEYGVFKGEERIGGVEEEDIYNVLGLPYVPPELREGADVMYKVPAVISREDIVCDVHTHTVYSDGKNTVEEMVEAALVSNLKQIGISDHIANAVYGNKLMTEGDARQAWLADIATAQQKHPEIKILKGAEVDISVDGELSLPPNVDELDYVIASAHTVPHTNLTQRFLKAIKCKKVIMLGHPTGREYLKRGEGKADWKQIFESCARARVALEINGVPGRLDLPEHLVKLAILCGCKVICTSDAHNSDMIERDLNYAVSIARRAGVEKDNIITDLESFIKYHNELA